MRLKNLLIISFILCLKYTPCYAANISISASDANVRCILTSLAAANNINIVINDDIQGTISINLKNISPIKAIQAISQIKNFQFYEKDGIFFISSRKTINYNFKKQHIFKIKYADLNMLADFIKISTYSNNSTNIIPKTSQVKITSLKSNASTHGKTIEQNNNVILDKENNCLLFFGTDLQAKQLEQFIKKIDVPARQVVLEARVIALQKDASKNLGIEWDWSEFPQYPQHENSYSSASRRIKNADGTYSIITDNTPTSKTIREYNGSNTIPGVIQFGKGPEGIPFEFYYGAKINALITQGKASVLAKPNIMTLNNHQAVITIGGSVPVPKLSTINSTTTTSYEYHKTGIILCCTPRINDDNYITAAVHTEVSSPLYIETLKAYRFQTRAADTTVRLKDGETIAIGGLIGSEESKNIRKIPFLGDLPILGKFFRNTKKSKSESEIIIFLTAHIKNKI
ncbi:type II secretion system protein GspD [Pectinatus sottacetonis]|uniref:type II secretion system protein GspD n=1 Tax=Pectinatus sottacetonis TaxID=1002795 RepID=UPI0018C55005|nr:type II secretion system protein GspD [Pectinatus sottacetonis]